MKLRTIKMSNVMCYENERIELSDSLTMLVGDSDSGKSVVIRALQRAAKNEPAGVDLLRNGVKRGVNSEVTLEGENQDGEFVIGRIRGKSTNEYRVNGNTLRAIGTGSPEEVDAILNLSPNAVQTQYDGHFLLSATDGQIARTIGSAIGLAEIDRMFAYMRTLKSDNDAKVRTAERIEEQEVAALAKYDGVTEVGEVVAELAGLDDEVQRLTAKVFVAGSAKSSLASLPDVSTIVARLKDVAGYVGAIAEIGLKIATCEADVERAATLHDVLASGNPVAVLSDVMRVDNELADYRKYVLFLETAELTLGRLRELKSGLTVCDYTHVADVLQEVKGNCKLAWDTDGVASMCAIKLESLNKHRRALLTYADHTDGLNDVTVMMGDCEVLSREWHNTVATINRLRDLQRKMVSRKDDHGTANRELMQVKSAMMKFKTDNTECPECGASQEHWRR